MQSKGIHIFCARAARVIRRRLYKYIEKTYCHVRSTYTPPENSHHLARLFNFVDETFILKLVNDFPGYSEKILKQATLSLNHIFDLLGSGPQVVKYGMQCPGFNGISYQGSLSIAADASGDWLEGRINRKNASSSREIWKLISPGYAPIDWQLDFKSGYRWDEKTWHGDIPIGKLSGVDIKIPWELSRMQHLPNLALAAGFSKVGEKGFGGANVYFSELRNQILDFIATNPPGFGVNWVCPMDVAIRAVNLLVARDLALSSGESFDTQFEKVFYSSIYDHIRHVVTHLEWDARFRGNHYLANIVGLLFGSIYLPCNKKFDGWLAFSVQELLTECDYQFYSDGSNFEGSVCYHRLSAEMLLWSFALLSNLPSEKAAVLKKAQQHRTVPKLQSKGFVFHKIPGTDHESPLPRSYWELLNKTADFTFALTRPDGLVVQFGDNDSGRLITLGSGGQLCSTDEMQSLDHSGLVAGIRSIMQKDAGSEVVWDPAAYFLLALANLGGQKIEIGTAKENSLIGDNLVWKEILEQFQVTPSYSKWTSSFATQSSHLQAGLEYLGFPGMGCYVFKGTHLYLAVRCGKIGLSGLGAHDHCDQLGIELVIDGHTYIRDPGTMIYTPSLELRNTYRSALAHYVPRVAGKEPADLTKGVFELSTAKDGECLYFGPKGFIGRHFGYGQWVYRIIVLEEKNIFIHDFGKGLQLVDPAPKPLPFSPAYGQVDTSNFKYEIINN